MSEPRVSLLAVVVTASLLAGARPAAGGVPPPGPVRSSRPPDPRLGERLDGRAPPQRPHRVALAVPRLVLTVPRAVTYAVLWPAAKTSQVAEEHRVYDRVYWALTSDDQRRGIRPALVWESSFLPLVGAHYFDYRTLGINSTLDALVLTLGPSRVVTGMRLAPPADVAPVGLAFLFDRRPDLLFAGTRGLRTDDVEDLGYDRARYGRNRYLVTLGTPYYSSVGLPPSRLKPLLSADLDIRDYYNGDETGGDQPIADVWCADPAAGCDSVSPELVPGYDTGLRLVRLNGGLAFDTRPWVRGSGAFGGVLGSWAHGFGDDDSHFWTVGADAAYAFDLHDRWLILRGLAAAVEPIGDAPVPFEELVMPGGSEGLRGVPTGLLRYRSGLVGTVEYRWLLASYLDAALFVDGGGAYGSWFEDITWDRTIVDFGLGLRLFKKSRRLPWAGEVLARLQVAWAPGESFRVFFSGVD